MNLHPISLEYGERFGLLTVLRKEKTTQGTKYRVGCVCGFSGMLVRANALMRGRVKACRKCARSKGILKEIK